MISRKHTLRILERTPRSGFTLVEMLVAVALVLLMMSMFTEVFSLATGTMSRQKGLAENDQRARMVATLLGSDFRKRSFRDVVPFMSGMTKLSPDSGDLKRGYLEYSENNPADETDDVLRLTIDTTRTAQDIGRDSSYNDTPELDVARDDFLLYGKATALGGGVTANPNQPEGDDGVFSTANGTGQSTAAEVVWFLRGGNLYRRALLIRKPYRTDTPTVAKYDATTGTNPPSATPLITGGYASFWNDFDYSAFYNSAAGTQRVQFHVYDSLINSSSSDFKINVGTLGLVPISLGIPPFRFGHSINTTSFTPREFDQAGTFIGSFTHEETSHANFKFPGQPVTANTDDPYSMPITLNTATNGITQFSNGPRVGEDILLSNVVSFDIKIWDPGVGTGPDGQPGFKNVDDDSDGNQDNASEYGGTYLGQPGNVGDTLRGTITDDGAWVDLGHSNSNGLYSRSGANSNGSGTGYGNRFDTWSPVAGLGFPPYLPARFVPQGTPLATTHPTRSVSTWTANNPYTPGAVVLPNADMSGNFVDGFRFAYRCISAGTSSSIEPTWNAIEWAKTTEPPTGMVSGPTWEAVPNLIPVRALQIKIRYLDVSSGLLKDLTLIESLCDSM